MSQVKVNNIQLDEVSDHISKANEMMNEILEEWADNFINLYHDFVDSGFLDELYSDAESQYYHLANAGYVVSYTLGGASGGAAVGGLVGLVFAPITATLGAVIGGIIGFFFGIYHMATNPNSVKWKYDSKNVLIDLLLRCKEGDEDNYTALYNEKVKFELMLLALVQLRNKINEYQQLYANLEEAAKAYDLSEKLDYAKTGDPTILGINSEVTIDGQTKTVHASDAMNAVFTYTSTVMEGTTAADYLARTYGYDINYMDIVKNANSFMSNTISSGLYSHEFVDHILPEFYPNASQTYGDAAYNAVTGATGVDLDHIQSALKGTFAGSIALFGGLLGSSFVGNVAKPKSNGNPTGPGGGYNGGSGTAPIVTPVVPTPVNPDPVEPDPEEPDPVEPDPEEPEPPKNDIEIEPVIEDIELPEKEIVVELNPDGEVDYDAIARDEFEFSQEYDDLIAHRTEIIEDIENKFATGDLDSIRAELKEYGYSSAEIEAIILDKHKTIKAIIEGDQNAQIAKIARELAEKNGIKDYTSKYEEKPNYDDLNNDGPSDSLMLPSEDPTIVEAKVSMDEAKTKYEEAVVAANALIVAANDSKNTMLDIKTKYETEFGTDTHMWTEEAVNEYNASIKAYNEAATKADEQVKNVEEAKTAYYDSRKEFEDKKEAYRKKAKEDYEKIEQTPQTPVEDTMTPDEIQRQIDQSVVIDGDSISFVANAENEMPVPNSAPVGAGGTEPVPDNVGVSYTESVDGTPVPVESDSGNQGDTSYSEDGTFKI